MSTKKSYQEESVSFFAKQVELLKELPEEFHKPLAWIAYEKSHAYGFNEVLSTLSEMIFHLKEPVKKFEERIGKGTSKVKESESIKYPVCPFCKETMWPGVAYYRNGGLSGEEDNIYAWQCECDGWSKKIKKEWGIE